MAMIPQVSLRVKRLQVYERQLARKLAFDEFGDPTSKDETTQVDFDEAAGATDSSQC